MKDFSRLQVVKYTVVCESGSISEMVQDRHVVLSIHAISNDLEWHLRLTLKVIRQLQRLFMCNSTNISATFRTVSTDTARRAVPR